MNTNRRARLTTAAFGTFVVLSLAACGSGGDDAADNAAWDASASVPMPEMEWAADDMVIEMPTEDTLAGASLQVARGQADGGAAPAEAPSTESGREIITRGSVTVVSADPLESAASLAASVEQLGGFVEMRNENRATERSSANAWLRLRIPAAAMTSFVDGLAGLGEVRDLSISRDDVTAQGADLDARIDALEASIRRLTALIDQAETVEDLLTAERELTWRQSDLDSIRSQRATLTDQVQMSTLDVNLFTLEEVGPAPTQRSGFLGGLANGWDALLAFGAGVLMALGAALPWLIALGIVVLLTALWLRRRRARKAKVVSTSSTTSDSPLAEPETSVVESVETTESTDD